MAVTDEVEGWARGLDALMGRIAPRFGRVEPRRRARAYLQGLLAPVVTTLMFLAILSVAFGRGDRMVGDLPFLEFLAPGLIMMAIIQNAFA